MGWEGAGSSVGRRPVNDCGLRTSSFCQTNLLSFLRPPRRAGYYVISLLLHLLGTSISASAQESKKGSRWQLSFHHARRYSGWQRHQLLQTTSRALTRLPIICLVQLRLSQSQTPAAGRQNRRIYYFIVKLLSGQLDIFCRFLRQPKRFFVAKTIKPPRLQTN